MNTLDNLEKNLKARVADREEYENWLENNPTIKARVDRLNNEALLAEKRAGIAAIIAFPILAAGPLGPWASLGFAAESGRQLHKGY